jgi:citrate synthase
MSDLQWKTALTRIEANKISVRGYALDDLLGRVSFPQMIYLLFKGEMPSANIGKMIEAILVSSIDHGTTPPSVLSAITVASTGASLNASVAAGILAISEFHGGAIEACMRILQRVVADKHSKNCTFEEAAAGIISDYQKKNKRLSGFGHRLHTNDPRTKRLFQLARELNLAGDYVTIAGILETELEKTLGKRLPLNVDGAIAALLCEMDVDVNLANAFFMIARLPGLVAHIQEEKTRYKPMRKIHPTDVIYDGPEQRQL